MNTEPDALVTAKRMVAIRGFESAQSKCLDYIEGKVRSENTRDFWSRVLHLISSGKAGI